MKAPFNKGDLLTISVEFGKPFSYNPPDRVYVCRWIEYDIHFSSGWKFKINEYPNPLDSGWVVKSEPANSPTGSVSGTKSNL